MRTPDDTAHEIPRLPAAQRLRCGACETVHGPNLDPSTNEARCPHCGALDAAQPNYPELTAAQLLTIADESLHGVLRAIVGRGCKLAIYENHDLGHYELGRLVFLSYGHPESTFSTPPPCAPNSADYGLGWRYLPVAIYTADVI